MCLCCDDVLLEEAQEGSGSSSLFVPTEVCQTGILGEQCLRKRPLPVNLHGSGAVLKQEREKSRDGWKCVLNRVIGDGDRQILLDTLLIRKYLLISC